MGKWSRYKAERKRTQHANGSGKRLGRNKPISDAQRLAMEFNLLYGLNAKPWLKI